MQNTKKVLLRLIKILAVLLPAVLMIVYMPVSESESTRRTRDFYLEDPHSLDVVMLGASEIYSGFSPVLAYEEFGFTSYDYSLSANFIDLFFEQLKMIYSVQSPNFVVIDIGNMNADTTEIGNFVLRQYAAGLPSSPAKHEMIRKLGEPSHMLSYYLPFLSDHNKLDLKTVISNARSSQITLERGYSLLKGSITTPRVGDYWPAMDTSGDLSTAPLPSHLEEKLNNLLSQCREAGFNNLLFVNFPHRITSQERYNVYQYTNTAGALVESYGYNYINLDCLQDKIGIVPETDFYDDEHMNLFGQYKTTRYLSRILTEEYGIQGREQSAENKLRWDTCVEYRIIYEDIFQQMFADKTRNYDDFWLLEDVNTIQLLEQAKSTGSYTLER